MKKALRKAQMNDILRALSTNSRRVVIEDRISGVSGPDSRKAMVTKRLFDSLGARLEPIGLILSHAQLGWKPDSSPDEVSERLAQLGFFDRLPSLDSPSLGNLSIGE